MTLGAISYAIVAAFVSLTRWLRISQREHYLPWSVLVTARRWTMYRPPNKAVAYLWVSLSAVSLALSGTARRESLLAGIVAATVSMLFPVGMSVTGRPRLRLTRRAVFQGITAAVLSLGFIVMVAFTLDVGLAVSLASASAAVAVDIAACIHRPIERQIAQRYKRAADEKLKRIKPRVIAITGSYGKTTVKNHVRELVGTSFDTLATPASWNNMAGLSRAINEQLTPTTEIFIAEMGTYGPREISDLTAWIKPEVAVITAVGPVHLERMRTLEAITAAKSEILTGARVAVVCVDSPMLRQVADHAKKEGSLQEVWIVGSNSSEVDLDVRVCKSPTGDPNEPQTDDMLTVWVRGKPLGQVPRDSLHASNVACAVAAALAIGVDHRVISSALSKLTATNSRAEARVTEHGLTVIDDTFNSNPTGAAAALLNLTRLVERGRRVVITPGMVEIGHLQYEANRRWAEQIAASGSELVVVGWTNRAALLAGHPSAIAVRDRETARRWVKAKLGQGDGVLWENDLPDHYP